MQTKLKPYLTYKLNAKDMLGQQLRTPLVLGQPLGPSPALGNPIGPFPIGGHQFVQSDQQIQIPSSRVSQLPLNHLTQNDYDSKGLGGEQRADQNDQGWG